MGGKIEGKGILSPVLSPGGGGHVGAYFNCRGPERMRGRVESVPILLTGYRD